MVMGQDLGTGWGAEGQGLPCWLPGHRMWRSVGRSEDIALHLVDWSGVDSVRVDGDIHVTVCELDVHLEVSNHMIRDSSFMSCILSQSLLWFWGAAGQRHCGVGGSGAQQVSSAQRDGAPRSPYGSAPRPHKDRRLGSPRAPRSPDTHCV